MLRLALPILCLASSAAYQFPHHVLVAAPRPCLRARPPLAVASDGEALISGDQQSEPEEDNPIDERTSAELYKNLKTKEFSDDLYRHLASRKDVEGTQLYTELRKRVDVETPGITSELKKRLIDPTPQPQYTAGEVIETVLMALRSGQDDDNDFNGCNVLSKFSGPGCMIGGEGVTPEKLCEYFAGSSYSILLKWTQLHYTRKLEVSMDKKRALQALRLKSPAGEWVPVTFQLSTHETVQGECWLIQSVLVQASDRALD